MSTDNTAVRNASTRKQKKRRMLQAQGAWQPFVDAEPVREHLRKVNAAGMPYMAICERLGLAQNSSLQHLMWGRGQYGPGQQVRRETAELVLSYWPSLDDFPEASRIDATGTRRRIEALAARGWPREVMAEQVGMGAVHFRKVAHRERVTARIARAVAAMYDAWWNQDPVDHGVPQRSVDRVRSAAARAGLHGPLAWDDDTIDDPNAVPQTDALEPAPTAGDDVVSRFLMGESVVLDRAGQREVIRYLMEWTDQTTEQIGAQLDMTGEAVERSWFRIRARARKEGAREPWRRVYIPKTELKRDEMESAA